ncbi:unnamed protein product, partial [Allacma fusca]
SSSSLKTVEFEWSFPNIDELGDLLRYLCYKMGSDDRGSPCGARDNLDILSRAIQSNKGSPLSQLLLGALAKLPRKPRF